MGRALACAGLLVLLALAGCDRDSKSGARPSASAEKREQASQHWVDGLDPKLLAAVDLQNPKAVVQALARRRTGHESLIAPPTNAAARKKAKTKADALLDHGFSMRNNPDWKPKPPIDWSKNPKQDSNWHYNINSLRPLTPLVEAYQAGAGDKYLEVARSVALDWIDFNLIEDRPNQKKWHDMGTALRAQVLGIILDSELHRREPDVLAVGRLVWALAEHAKFLSNPKLFTLGNHGVYMMRGLAWTLKALPELKHRTELERYANERMKKLLEAQFASDGLHLEHSPGYHTLITGTFEDLVSEQLFPNMGELQTTVDRARRHFGELYHPNGDLALLGDTDRGDRRHALDSGAWPLAADRSPLHVYPESGYAVFRTHYGARASASDDYLLLGAGHHSRVHKHADHLSFEWSFRGSPILIDSGKYTYNKDKWRRFFTSTRAGNAVEVDQADYDITPSAGKSKLSAWGELPDAHYVVAKHRDKPLGVTQTRTLVISTGNYLLVVDQLRSKKQHTYNQWFHFHESLDVTAQGAELIVKSSEHEPLLMVRELEGGSSKVELIRGQTEPRIQGFVSGEYLVKAPRFSAAFRKQGTDVTWATLFSRERAEGVHVREEKGRLSVSWRDSRGRHGFSFTPEAKDAVVPLEP
jgi:hypothetical protein